MNSSRERFIIKGDHKVHTGIYWTNLELKGLLEDEDSCVYYERRKKHVGVHPHHVQNVIAGLSEIMNSGVNSYDAELKGFLLVYKNPAILNAFAETLRDDGIFHIDIEADFYIFKPQIGDKLKGFVNKKGLNHIGVLVHKEFIVSIPQPDEEEDWPGKKLNIGQEVRFTVNEVDFRNKLPYIRGVLHEDEYLEGCKLFNVDIEEADKDIGSPNRKRKITFNEDFISDPSVASAKKRKRITFDSDSQEEENGAKLNISLSQGSSRPELENDLEAEDQKPRKKKSHKKARMSKENNHILSPSSEDEETGFKSPLKKSRTKSNVSADVKLNFDSEEDKKPTHLVQRFVEESEDLGEDRKPLVKKSKKRRKRSERDETSGAESEESRESKHKIIKAKFSQENLEVPSSDLEDRKPINLLVKHKSKSNEKSEKKIKISEYDSDASSLQSSQEKKKFKKKSNPKNLINDNENVLENQSEQVNGNEGHKKRKPKSENKSEEIEFSFDILSRIKTEPSDKNVKKEPSDTAKTTKIKKIEESD